MFKNSVFVYCEVAAADSCGMVLNYFRSLWKSEKCKTKKS